jgi:hypothetical protein
MKKIAYALLLSSLAASTGFAKGAIEAPAACDYSDYFHISDDSVGPLTIASLTGDANVVVVQKDTTSFYIKDTDQCPKDGGYAKVRYQKDGDNYCELTIHDAENMWDPDVSASCQGSVTYAGIKYDGIGSHSYSIGFNPSRK